MRKSWLVLLVGLTWSAPAVSATAQQEVLDSLISVALKNNPELSAATHARRSTEAAAPAAGALPDPLLSLGVMNLPVNSFSLDRTPMSGILVGLTQKIPWPGKLSARADLATAQNRAAGAGERMVRDRIVRQVTEAYFDYSYWSLARTLIGEYLVLLEGTRDIAEVRYAHGGTPAQDVLRAGSMASRTEIRLLTADQKRRSALLELRRAVGDTTLADELPAHLAEVPDDRRTAGSIEDNPLLAAASSGVAQAQSRKRLAGHEYAPDFTLGVDYRFREYVPGDPVQGADYLTFRLGVSLPLWFFARQKHSVQSAKQQLLASRRHEQSVRDRLTMQYHDALSRLSLIRESLAAYDRSILPESEAAAEAAEIAYEVGEVDFNALLGARTDAFEVRLERLDLLRQYHQTNAVLTELVGSKQKR
jgi:outer membrane protein TolC